MASSISLSAGIRTNLLSLQQTDSLLQRTQARLATGKKINSALDGAQAFFASRANESRIDSLKVRKDGFGQSIQVVKAANNGIEAVQNLIGQAQGIISSAKGSISDTSDDADLAAQYAEVLAQIDTIVGDSGYQGTNLLGGAAVELVTTFDPAGSDTLTSSGFDATAVTGLSAQATITPATLTNLDAADAALVTANTTLESKATSLTTSVSIIDARDQFTAGLINTLEEGNAKLILADTNEEGASLLALQTRQQLSIISLSLANQSNQSVLRLF